MPVITNPSDPGFQEAVKQWGEAGYDITPRGEAPPLKFFASDELEQFKAQGKAVIDSMKLFLGDKDIWQFTGAWFVEIVDIQTLNGYQIAQVDKIRAIVEKEGEISYKDSGTLLGCIMSLMLPSIQELLQKQAPGLLSIINVLIRFGGVA
jgi:hypothetical protein